MFFGFFMDFAFISISELMQYNKLGRKTYYLSLTAIYLNIHKSCTGYLTVTVVTGGMCQTRGNT